MKDFDENDIYVADTSYHKHMTDNHLAQINFVAVLPVELWDSYIEQTSIDNESLKRIRFMRFLSDKHPNRKGVMVWGRVSHGYGYDISQDIVNSILK